MAYQDYNFNPNRRQGGQSSYNNSNNRRPTSSSSPYGRSSQPSRRPSSSPSPYGRSEPARRPQTTRPTAPSSRSSSYRTGQTQQRRQTPPPYRPPHSSQPPQQEEKKPNTPTRKTMNPALYFLIILLISVACSFILITAANDVFAFVKPDEETTITVPADTTVSDLSKTLKKDGIIRHKGLFKLFLKVSHKDTNVLAGDYLLNSNMDYSAIIRSLRNANGDSNIVSVTIPEGYTIQQIREVLQTKHVVDDAAELNKALNQYQYNYEFLSGMTAGENWLEGYLFPDTYQFYLNDNAINVIDKMLTNFQKKYDDNIKKGAEQLGLKTNEVVIIASMIEREAKLEDEFAMISGVIHNRMENSSKFPYLQIDATVQYAVGHKEELTAADLEVDSPYNTYKYKGLPPGPIASPGYTALYAATHPEEHNYYYYVAMPDGSHLFSTSKSEHNKNIEKSKAAFAAQGAN